MSRAKLAALSLGLVLCLGLSDGDPGVLLELDLEEFVLVTHDLANGTRGPALRVGIGSPANPTPEGEFPLHEVVLNPGWSPGPRARASGAESAIPSTEGPLGVAKIPFSGAVSVHGGAHPRVLGKPISLGCVRAADADLLELVAWLGAHSALGGASPGRLGEVRVALRRTARFVVR